MPIILNILKSIAIIVFGVFAGYGLIKYFIPQEKGRVIAANPLSKMDSEQYSRYAFNIKINNNELAQTEEGVSIIKVSIEALKNFNTGLNYSWKLPQDVELVEGFLNGDLESFSSGQSKDFILRVRGFSKQLKKFITFEVQGDLEQRPIRREILISSRIEDSLEYAIQQNELNRSKNQIYKLDGAEPKSRFSPDRIVR